MSTLVLIGLKSALVLAVALMVVHSKGLTAAARHFILVLAMLSIPLLVILNALSPPMIPFEPPTFSLPWPFAVETGAVASASSPNAASHSIVLEVSFTQWYVMVCAGFLGYWCLQVYLTSRWVARTRLLSTQIQTSKPLRRRIVLRQSRHNGSPVTWGVMHPAIIVPPDWDAWSRAKQQAVIAHEVAHIRRMDVLTSLMGALIASVCWANPLVWIARRKSLEAAEQACDDAVIIQGVSPTSYASALLEITRSRTPHRTVAMAATSKFSERIHALVDTSTRRAPMTLRQASTVLVLGLTLIAALGTVGASSSSALAEQRNVDSIGARVYDQLSAVQELIDGSAHDAALAALDELLAQPQTLNANEIAQIHNMRGFIHFRIGDYAESVKDYEAVLVQADEIPKGLQVATMYTLAQLSFVTENYPKAIEHMTTWIQEAENPGAIPYVFLGQVYLQMRDFPGALENVRKGIRTAEESGVQVQDTWTKLEAYLQSAIDQGGRIADFPLSGQGVDGEYLPIVKVAPIYPPRAQREKTEGYVELEFAVSRTGRVVDPVVVESHPPGVFDRAALDAVTRFKYKPRVSAGEPVEVAGVRNRITFELD